MPLEIIWFGLIGVLITGYAILDGFDLGVGMIYLFARKDRERRILLNSIGPVWDGNEVWLVVGGGSLFAAFPEVYATVFSGFYLAFIFLLLGLIFRAVSIEFRGQKPQSIWRNTWDIAFGVSSTLVSFLFGVAVGNLTWGIPLTSRGIYAGTFTDLLHPYALFTGALVVSLWMMHGNLYAALKAEGKFRDRLLRWSLRTNGIFTLVYPVFAVWTLLYIPHTNQNLRETPLLAVIPLLNLAAVGATFFYCRKRKPGAAFAASSTVIASLMLLFGAGIYPRLVVSNPNPEYSLTVFNASSSQGTLGTMLIIALIGVPLVLVYTAGVYYAFRGKVTIDESSY